MEPGAICKDSSCDKEVARRIGLAAGIVRNLHKIWKASNISKSTKVGLRVFEMSVFRKICGVARRDRRRNLDILNSWMSIRTLFKSCRMQTQNDVFRPCDHYATRMGSDRYPHLLLRGFTHGNRPKGRPRKKRHIRDNCKEMGFSIYEASQLATQQPT